MDIVLHIYHHNSQGDREQLVAIVSMLERLFMNIDEATKALTDISNGLSDVGAQLTKGFDEITADIAKLQQAGGTTPEQDALLQSINEKLGAVKAAAQKLDDIVPDATPTV
jgi:hypothetical protein